MLLQEIEEHNEYANIRTSLVSSVLIKPTSRRNIHIDINSLRNMNKLTFTRDTRKPVEYYLASNKFAGNSYTYTSRAINM